MLQKIRAAWRRNHGTPLFAIACVAGLIMCVLWYKQWVPEVNFANPATFTRLADKGGAPSYFVARIIGPVPATEDTAVKGVLSLFAYGGSDDVDERVPTVMHEFQFDPDGAVTIVQELRPGQYSAFAFLDLNGNGRIDLDDAGIPLEPFRTSAATLEPQDFKNLEPAAFEVAAGSPFFCVMLFDR
jgi:hypothetical protein